MTAITITIAVWLSGVAFVFAALRGRPMLQASILVSMNLAVIAAYHKGLII